MRFDVSTVHESILWQDSVSYNYIILMFEMIEQASSFAAGGPRGKRLILPSPTTRTEFIAYLSFDGLGHVYRLAIKLTEISVKREARAGSNTIFSKRLILS